MPRQARVVVPGVAMHLVQRGHNRAACFAGENDRLAYLANLRELAPEHGCEVHAYCLMTNHVHLLVTPQDEEGCASLMRDLGQRYVQYYNRRYARSGTLWEGRFRSCLVQSARYVLACYRYIELNPVRAGMVTHPVAHPWSSVHVNAVGRADPLVSPHPEYLALGEDGVQRRATYGAILELPVAPTLLDGIREATRSGYPLASDAFKAELKRRGVRIEPGRAGRPSGKIGDGARLISRHEQEEIGL